MTESKDLESEKSQDFVILTKPSDPKFLGILQDQLQTFDSILVIVPPKIKLSLDVLQSLLCHDFVSFYHVKFDEETCKIIPTKGLAVIYDCILLWETNSLLSTFNTRDVAYDIIREVPHDSATVFGFIQSEISNDVAKITDRFVSTPRTIMIADYLLRFRDQHESDEDSEFLARQCTEWLKESKL